MFDNDDNPIKESTPFRIGLDNLTESDDINYTDDEAYDAFSDPSSDFHECSNDLSDEGSRKEELAHARYAEYKRQTYNSSSSTTKKILVNGQKKWIIYVILFFFVGIPVIETLAATVIGIVGLFAELNDDTPTVQTVYEPYEENEENSSAYNQITQELDSQYNFDELKENIYVFPTYSVDGRMNFEVKNENDEAVYDAKIQIIFFDELDKPINITQLDEYTLLPKSTSTHEIYNVPKHKKYEVLITDKYAEDATYTLSYAN